MASSSVGEKRLVLKTPSWEKAKQEHMFHAQVGDWHWKILYNEDEGMYEVWGFNPYRRRP